MAPGNENELRHMLKTAVDFNGPVALRYPRGEGVGAVLAKELICLKTGQAEMLSPGKDVALLGIGDRVNAALQAADILQKQGINAAVINARFVKPLDEGMLRRICREIGILVTIEDHVLQGGFGSAVGEYLHAHGWGNVKLLKIGLPDQFVEHGPRKLLLDKYGLSAERIAEQTLRFLREQGVCRRNAKIIN